MIDRVTEEINNVVVPKLKDTAIGIRNKFLNDFSAYIDSSKAPRIAELLDEAGDLEIKAIAATDLNLSRQYAQAAANKINSMKTIAIGEEIVAAQATANWLADAAGAVWGAFMTVGKGLVSAVATGLVDGAIRGLGGGGDEDAASFR